VAHVELFYKKTGDVFCSKVGRAGNADYYFCVAGHHEIILSLRCGVRLTRTLVRANW